MPSAAATATATPPLSVLPDLGKTSSVAYAYEYEKYVTTPDKIRETIDKYGVAIVPSVLDENECNEMKEGMWNTLEQWTADWDMQINRDNPESWKQIKHLFPKHSMLIQQYGLGHADFIWRLRQNPKCVGLFADLWKCTPDDLLVSFDAASFHMPPEVTNIGWHRNTWFHVDQSPCRPQFECIQSWVTAFDVNDGDATLAILEGSNKYHEEFGKYFNITSKDDWYKFDKEEEKQFYNERGCRPVCIKCPRGSMVFWDSRTAHCGVEAMKGRSAPNTRCVVYLCYMPRTGVTSAVLKKKMKAFEERRMTSHWANRVKLFPKMPYTYGAEIKKVRDLDLPFITPLGRRLAGYTDK